MDGRAVLVCAAITPHFALEQFDVGFLVGGIVNDGCLVRHPIRRRSGTWSLGGGLERPGPSAAKGWLVTENLACDNVDVDHVVVTPSDVLAVEAKYHRRRDRFGNRMDTDVNAPVRPMGRGIWAPRRTIRRFKLCDISTGEAVSTMGATYAGPSGRNAFASRGDSGRSGPPERHGAARLPHPDREAPLPVFRR